MNEIENPRRPGTGARVLLLFAAVAFAALLLSVGFPPGAPDRLPVLVGAVTLALVAAARPARAIGLFAFLAPCAGLLARIFGGMEPSTWPSMLAAGLFVGWCFRFLYDFESRSEPVPPDRPLRALLAIWTLSTVVAIARALTLWAAARRLSGRVVNGEGLSDAVAIKETLFAFAALAGGVAFYLLLRRAGDEARRRALTGALAGGAVSALAAVLQVLGLLPGESRAYWGRLGRLSGGAIDPNSLGISCALLLVVVFSRALQPGRRRALSLGLSLLLAAGLALSGSRSGAGMAGLGLLLVLFAPALPARARISAIAALALVGGAALIALAAGARGNVGARILQTFDPSLPAEFRFSARPLLWRAAGRLFLEHPAAGAGMGVFAWRFPDLIAAEGRSVGARDNPGSGYVQALAETGAVGFLVTAAAALSLAAQAFRKWRMPDAGSDGPAAGVAVAAFLVALAIGSHWLAADVGLVFFLLAARCGDDAERSGSGQPGAVRAWSGRALAVAVGAYALAATAAILATSDPAETFRYSSRIGFHDLERGPGGAFRWTKQRFALRVSPGDAPLRLGLANFGPSGAPVTLEARSGDRSSPAVRRTLRPGGATALWIAPGTSPAVVTFSLDRSFVPRRLGVSADRRRLGLLSTSSTDAMGR